MNTHNYCLYLKFTNKNEMSKANGLLGRANSEIKSLRRSNEGMTRRLNMFDDMMRVFNAGRTYGGESRAEDVTYDIDKFLTEEKDAH